MIASTTPKISPFAPASFPSLPTIDGVRMASAHAGFKKESSLDLTLFTMTENTSVAGVFTSSLCPSAAVTWCRQALPSGKARALVVNAGNANAFTGKAGRQSVRKTVQKVSSILGIATDHVFIASTGVIGEPLDSAKINQTLDQLHHDSSPHGWENAAHAIMTTDNYPKGSHRHLTIDGVDIYISGIAKGAGMIAPNMATMLAFIFTNAAIAPPLLQSILTTHNASSFNAITVDGDTSTSDTALLMATATASHEIIQDPSDPRLSIFAQSLHEVMHDLALQIVGDGEGAQKRIMVTVTGASSDDAARIIAFAIANSPLVKTAMAGSDANWGRIVMAIGKAGQKADPDKLSIKLCGIKVTHLGEPLSYSQEKIDALMQNKELSIEAELNIGAGEATVWTTDLNHDYITLNAHYRS